MTLPQGTIDKIKADAKHYMDVFVKGSVKYEDILPNDISDAHKAGATEWAGMAQVLVEALEAMKTINASTMGAARMKAIAATALAKYKEVSNG